MTPPKYYTAQPESVTNYPGGRQACNDSAAGKREYKARTVEMWERQNGICPICGNWIELRFATFDHQAGRGQGGGKRDDRILIEGEWQNAAVHYICNQKKGSQQYRWEFGKYVPVLREKEVA